MDYTLRQEINSDEMYYRLRLLDAHGLGLDTLAINFSSACAPASGILIYPNPTLGSLKIELNGMQSHYVKTKIIDMIGHTLQTKEFKEEALIKDLKLDLSKLPAATYVLVMQINGENYHYKIVKL